MVDPQVPGNQPAGESVKSKEKFSLTGRVNTDLSGI